jgi:DNA-binding transcriptional LysR family regulator
MHMNIRQLEVFAAVVEAGSFSRGAEAASLTQSTVSQHIASLESEAGHRLLDRTGQGILLTRAGEIYLQHTRRVLAECAALQQSMAAFNGLQHANLTIGASNIPANYLIPSILSQLTTDYPGIALTMQTGDSRAILQRLLEESVELAVVGSRNNIRGVDYLPLASDLIVLAVSNQHPWSQCKSISLDELCSGSLIVRENGSGSDQALQQALQQVGFDPTRLQISVRLGSNEAIRQTLAGGFGAAFLSEISIRQELSRGEMVQVHVDGLAVQRKFWLATRSRRTSSPAARIFTELIQDVFGDAKKNSLDKLSVERSD